MASVRPEPKQKARALWPRGYPRTEAKEDSMASVHNRGQKRSSFGLAPICFGPGTGAEYEK